MTKQQFEARLTQIEEQADAFRERADAYRDQHLARLFTEADADDTFASQEELAAYLAARWGEPVSRQWLGQHLLFGRFVQFFATSGSKEDFKFPSNLTERSFRGLWEATEAGGDFRGHRAATEAAKQDERRRFGLVLEELKAIGLPRLKKAVKEGLVRILSGKSSWLTEEQIRDKLAAVLPGEIKPESVERGLRTFEATEDAPYRIEKAGEGATAKYRMVRVKGRVVGKKQIAHFSADLIPMLEDLIREARKERVAISLTHLCDLASKIEKVLTGITAHLPALD